MASLLRLHSPSPSLLLSSPRIHQPHTFTPFCASASSSSSSSSTASLQDLLSTTRADASNASADSSFGSSLFGNLTDVIAPPLEPKPPLECPPGLCRYETMAVLRPDITEQERLDFTQRYEEAIVASGGMGLEIFNRGMMPLAYNIKKKDTGGVTNRYLDGIYFLFSYCAKPKSLVDLQKKFNTDDDVIRSSTFKVKPVSAS